TARTSSCSRRWSRSGHTQASPRRIDWPLGELTVALPWLANESGYLPAGEPGRGRAAAAPAGTGTGAAGGAALWHLRFRSPRASPLRRAGRGDVSDRIPRVHALQPGGGVRSRVLRGGGRIRA